MSCTYADGLSNYENKGILGRKEKFDSEGEVLRKSCILLEWINSSDHIVVHTGAGISTSVGIPDFRGPKGVWTLEKKGLKPTVNISFDDAIPSKTHMALAALIACGKIQYIISQNIDGLHLKSGIPRDKIAELHGNMFVDKCGLCSRQFVRSSASTSVGQKCLDIPCKAVRTNGRACRGKLNDTILDWEHCLPERELDQAELHSRVADLCICLGTTLQIVPSGTLPLHTKKNGGRLVIINLQPTKIDRKADLIINTYVDDVFELLAKRLGIEIPSYSPKKDATKWVDKEVEWTIPDIPKSTIVDFKLQNKTKKKDETST